MRWLHVLCGFAWIGAAVGVGAMLSVWGPDPAMGSGPPRQLERHVTGAILLSLITAITLSMSGRAGQPPAWWARGVAIAAAVGAIAVALAVRAKVRDEGTAHLLEGPGWTWMLCGGALAVAAASGALGLARPALPRGAARKRRR